MNRLSPFRWLTISLIALLLFSSMTALATSNTIPMTQLDDLSVMTGLNDKKPSECEGWFLTSLVSGSGIINGTSGNDLILGSSASDVIDGQGGDDCIL